MPAGTVLSWQRPHRERNAMLSAPKPMVIVVAGNIGCGKSSLSRWLAGKLGYEPWYESVDDNPYLEDFYRDMNAFSFHLQVYFLSTRIDTYRRVIDSGRPAILDRSIFEDAAIFARNAYETGIMNDRDYQTYQRIYDGIVPSCPPPDLLIYLQASVPTLMRRIAKRGRDCESTIPREYISQLNALYEEWIERYTLSPKLILPADDLDFVNSYHDFSYILDLIETMRRGPDQMVLPGMLSQKPLPLEV